MFKAAKPIWIKNYRQMCNLQCGFRSDFTVDKPQKCILKITGATVYRIYLNGKFIHYGPARAPHGYIRYDEVVIDAEKGLNKLAIEVAGYNCTGYYTLLHESFIIAELYDENGKIIAATGKDFSGLMLDKLRKRKVFRYTFQRDFSEVWTLNNQTEIYNWKINSKIVSDSVAAVNVPEEYIPRELPLPNYSIVCADGINEKGAFEHISDIQLYKPNLQNVKVSCEFHGYSQDIIEDRPAEELYGNYHCTEKNLNIKAAELKENEYAAAQFGFNNTGFLRTRIKAYTDSTVYLVFSEAKENDMIAFCSNIVNGVNAIKYSLKASDKEYDLETFEPYTCKHIGIIVTEGHIDVEGFSMREYCYPNVNAVEFSSANKKIADIFCAARETFRQNTVDVYMDCPSRERAPWLCDSYFMGYAEHFLTMDTKVEKVFFENFNIAKEFPCIPDGMVPMCYPSDHNRGVYIPQYALWFILQFEKFVKRSGLKDISGYKRIIYGIIDFFRKRLNNEGMLEDLEGWNFIEWSDANLFMKGVHIPTNMLFVKSCQVTAALFDDKELKKLSDELKEKIIALAFDGKYFADNALRDKNNILKATENKSEICQYISFFCNIAEDNKKFSDLKNELISKCGPGIVNRNLSKANAFVGNYIRMYLMKKWLKPSVFIQEIIEGFYKMAEITGTLWEHDQPIASRNHGFASYAAVAVFESITGITFIDTYNRVVYKNNSTYTDDYTFKINVKEGCIRVTPDKIDLPPDWKIDYSADICAVEVRK